MPEAEKTRIKQHIAAMKIKRDDAITRKAYEELHQIRRAIRTLKRKLRALVKEAKAAPVPVAEEATPAAESPITEAAETPDAPEATEAAANPEVPDAPKEAPAQDS